MIRRFGRVLRRLIVSLVAVAGGLWAFGPYEPVDIEANFDAAVFGDDIEAYLATQESQVADIQDGAQKRIMWAGDVGVKTPLAVVYFHGFSASSEEIRPVPDRVAQALGANLIYTRFAGHGIKNGGAALAQATVSDWMADAAEALAAARAVGERVIVLSTSTGGTIAAESFLQKGLVHDVAGVVFVSPNFKINDDLAFLLTWPGARYWVPLVAGKEQGFDPVSAAHEKFWTVRYPTVAVLALGALVKHAAAQDYGDVQVPALFYYSDADTVVSAQETEKIAKNWGGTVTQVAPDLGDGDDPNAHVIAGAIRSPGNTDATVDTILAWLGEVL